MANGDITQQEFVCSLTDAEVDDKRDNLVVVENELDYTKERKKSVVAEHTGYVKQLERERGDLLRAINSRSEKRKVDVQEEFCPETNSVVLRRLDNREIISERPMEAWERQQEMPFTDKSIDGKLAELDAGKAKTPKPSNGKRNRPVQITDFDEPEKAQAKRKGRPRKQPTELA
jgi:hypothetical protein